MIHDQVVGDRILLTDENGNPVVVQEKETCKIQCQLKHGTTNITLSQLASLKLYLYNSADKKKINFVDGTNILNTDRGTVSSTGLVTIRLLVADNPIVGTSVAELGLEQHIARLEWTWNDGVSTQTGVQELEFTIEKKAVLVDP